jgi:hypothetical protein
MSDESPQPWERQWKCFFNLMGYVENQVSQLQPMQINHFNNELKPQSDGLAGHLV